MKRTEFRFSERLRVRWAEVDMQKIVFNGHYLTYLDTAVSGYWRAMAMPYEDTFKHLGGELYMRKSTLEYHGSARYDDVLDVALRCSRVGQSSITLHGVVFRQDQALVSAELVYVFAAVPVFEPVQAIAEGATTTDTTATAVTLAAQPVPQQLRDVLHGFEAGKTMVSVRVGRWHEVGADAQRIRRAVFIDEQRIPESMEWDDVDASCQHAVAYNHFGAPLATGRLLEHVPGVAKIGRMAVLQSMRGSHVGRAVLDALMQAARARGDREAVLHAQVSAAPFYARAGFVPRGPVFDEVDIPHIEMVCGL